MINLRKEAKGRDCQIRVPGFCYHSSETVVGCHFPINKGIALKSHDMFIAWGCMGCHRVVDLVEKTPFTKEQIRLMHAEGVLRTQAILIKEGKL